MPGTGCCRWKICAAERCGGTGAFQEMLPLGVGVRRHCLRLQRIRLKGCRHLCTNCADHIVPDGDLFHLAAGDVQHPVGLAQRRLVRFAFRCGGALFGGKGRDRGGGGIFCSVIRLRRKPGRDHGEQEQDPRKTAQDHQIFFMFLDFLSVCRTCFARNTGGFLSVILPGTSEFDRCCVPAFQEGMRANIVRPSRLLRSALS